MDEGSRELELTERQRFWLGHLRDWQRKGGLMSEYAAGQGLSTREFYYWKRRLVGKGALGAPEGDASGPAGCLDLAERGGLDGTPEQQAVPRFQRVVVEQDRKESDQDWAGVLLPVCRVELPNGVRIELAGPLTAPVLGAVFKAAGTLS